MQDINTIVAHNLRFFMGREGSRLNNPTVLGKAAGVAANTVTNMLKPEKRTTTSKKPVGYPNLDNLVKVAKALNVQVWELLHPDIVRSLREREFYLRIERDFRSLPSSGASAAPQAPHARAGK